MASQQATRDYVGITAQRGLHVLIPPPAEQERICGYLRPRIQSMNRVVEAVKLQIERLKSYRQAVIAAGVTGQLDIRSVEAA